MMRANGCADGGAIGAVMRAPPGRWGAVARWAGRGRPGRRPRRATRRRCRRAGRRRGSSRAGSRRCRRRRSSANSSPTATGRAEPEGALGRGDEEPPGRLVLEVRPAAVPLDEVPGGGQVVGRLDGEGLDAGQRALDQAGERAGRRDLDDGGDAEVGQHAHAQVPAHGVAHLRDEPAQHVAAVVDDAAVGVGDQRDARVVRGDRLARSRTRVVDGRGHVRGVEGAGDLERAHAGALGRVGGEGGQLLERAGDDDLAGAVHVRRRSARASGPRPRRRRGRRRARRSCRWR